MNSPYIKQLMNFISIKFSILLTLTVFLGLIANCNLGSVVVELCSVLIMIMNLSVFTLTILFLIRNQSQKMEIISICKKITRFILIYLFT